MDKMILVSNIKEVAELITAISAAFIVTKHAIKIFLELIQKFRKSMKINKKDQEIQNIIIEAVNDDNKTHEVFLLNLQELNNYLYNSKLFTKIEVPCSKH